MAETTEGFLNAGTILSISAAHPATLDAAGYAALSFTEVDEIVNYGDYGRTYTMKKHRPVGNKKTFKLKGGYDDGDLSLEMAKVPSGAGQALLEDALDSTSNYTFKIEFNDNPEGLTNTIHYFEGKVFSNVNKLGDVDAVVSKNVNIGIDGDILEVAATDS